MNATKTVLVIDDEAATLTMFRLFLNAYGYSVLTAENGETGLRLVREHHPGIVFTDLKIPGMDGFEVLRQVKKTAPETEVLVITGHVKKQNDGGISFCAWDQKQTCGFETESVYKR